MLANLAKKMRNAISSESKTNHNDSRPNNMTLSTNDTAYKFKMNTIDTDEQTCKLAISKQSHETTDDEKCRGNNMD